MASSVTPLRTSIPQAIFGVAALSCGIPLPSHQGCGVSFAATVRNGNIGVIAAAPIALIKFLRESMDLIIGNSRRLRSASSPGYAFFHKPIRCVETTRTRVVS
jgi:hypothetical protein